MSLSIHSPEIRDDIVQHMLGFVSSYGWSHDALKRAVVQAGFQEQDAWRAFEGDLDKVLQHFIHMIDRQMLEKLQLIDLASMRVRERIATALMIRLDVLEPYRIALPKVLLYRAHPLRTSQTFQSLFSTVSEIWYAAGDQATDFNYYSKRLLLSGVYTSTFFFWLRDSSTDFAETRAFLNRRIDDVMKLPFWTQKIKETAQSLKKIFAK